MDPVYFTCQKIKQQASSYIICINQNNNQIYVMCPKCHRNTDKKYKEWHQITDHETIDHLSEELNIELIKYKKYIFKLIISDIGIRDEKKHGEQRSQSAQREALGMY